MATVIRASFIVGLLLVGVLAPKPVAAQDATHRAQNLFERALQALSEGRAAEGRDLLRRSLEILPTVPTRYNLALALRRTGEPTRSLDILEVLSEGELGDEDRQRVEMQLQEVRAEVGHVIVTIRGAREAELEVDGQSEGAVNARQPREILVDPGEHVIVARGETSAREEIEVDRGARMEITLTLPPPTPAGAAVDDSPNLWWLWTGIGVLVAAGAITTVLLLTSGPPDPITDNFTGIRETLRF